MTDDQRLYEEMNGLPEIAAVLEDFRKATGMPFLKLVAPGAEGPFLQPGDAANPLCHLVRESPGTCHACACNQSELLRAADSDGLTRCASCFVGLTEFAVPVIEGSRHVATIVSGQVFLRRPSEEEFAAVAARIGPRKGKKWLASAREVFFGTPVVPGERVEAVMRLLGSFAVQLSQKAGQHALASSTPEHRAVKAAKEYVEAAKGEITIDRILDHVHVSRFHFCKIFRKNTGMTFTEYANRYRIGRARELLADPALRISDVAYGAGFGSIARFNSLFRRETGMSPTAYRRSLTSPIP